MSDTSTPPATRPPLTPGGPLQDQDAGMQDGDFGLDGDMKGQLLAALEQRWNADDPGATNLDDPAGDGQQTTDTTPPADTAATPAPASDPPVDSSQGQPDGTGDGGGGAADDGQGAAASTPDDPAAPASAPTPDDTFDLNSYFRDYFGTPLNREQAQHLAGILGGLQNLTPQQRLELDRVLAGEATSQYPATTGVPVQPAQQPTMQPQTADASDPAVAILGPRPDDDYLAQNWDLSARAVRAQQEQLSTIQQEIARTTQMELERQHAAATAKIDAAMADWRSTHTVLSDAEFDALRARAERSGIFPALVQQHHGDVDQATRALFDQHFWADPQLRDRAIANLQSGRTPGDHTQIDPNSEVAQQQAATDNGRQALAASVAGGGGSITPSGTEIPRDPEKKKAAMAQEIAAQHEF